MKARRGRIKAYFTIITSFNSNNGKLIMVFYV